MLDYSTCLELKEAGFPQIYKKTKTWMDWAYDKGGELHMLHEDNDTSWWIGNDYSEYDMDEDGTIGDWTKCPTLEELVEACGVDFDGFSRFSGVEVKDGWMAHTLGMKDFAFGKTPIEAVANLYLSLNPLKS